MHDVIIILVRDRVSLLGLGGRDDLKVESRVVRRSKVFMAERDPMSLPPRA